MTADNEQQRADDLRAYEMLSHARMRLVRDWIEMDKTKFGVVDMWAYAKLDSEVRDRWFEALRVLTDAHRAISRLLQIDAGK